MSGAAAALAAAATVLLIAALVAAPLLRASARARRLHARVVAVALPLAPARPRGGPLGARAAAVRAFPPEAWRERAATLLGWSRERRDQYPAAPPVIALGAAGAALALGQVAAALVGPDAWWCVAPGCVLLSRMAFGRIHGRRAERLYLQLPDALAMIVRAVRAGLPVTEAVRTVGKEALEPTGTEFRRLADQIALGVSFEHALRALARRSGLPEYNFFAVALTLQQQAGGNLTDTLENLADVVRRRVAMRARGIALASQAKASAAILGSVPVIAGLALALINPGYLAMLFDDPRGRVVLGLAIGMLGSGLFVMRTIIKKSLS